jgi:hypothetical protein
VEGKLISPAIILDVTTADSDAAVTDPANLKNMYVPFRTTGTTTTSTTTTTEKEKGGAREQAFDSAMDVFQAAANSSSVIFILSDLLSVGNWTALFLGSTLLCLYYVDTCRARTLKNNNGIEVWITSTTAIKLSSFAWFIVGSIISGMYLWQFCRDAKEECLFYIIEHSIVEKGMPKNQAMIATWLCMWVVGTTFAVTMMTVTKSVFSKVSVFLLCKKYAVEITAFAFMLVPPQAFVPTESFDDQKLKQMIAIFLFGFCYYFYSSIYYCADWGFLSFLIVLVLTCSMTCSSFNSTLGECNYGDKLNVIVSNLDLHLDDRKQDISYFKSLSSSTTFFTDTHMMGVMALHVTFLPLLWGISTCLSTFERCLSTFECYF